MKRLLSVLLVFAMLMAAVPVTAGAETGDLIQGTTRFSAIGLPEDEATFYYTDTYFDGDATLYDKSLATASQCFAMSAYGSVDAENGYAGYARNIVKFLEDTGFTGILINDSFQVKPTEDSVGTVVACKVIENKQGEKYTVVAVVSRSGNYEAEWASNFTIGESGRHQGFNDSAQEILSFLKDYIREYKSSFEGEVKIWTAGYSRGAVLSNLLAADLTKAARKGEAIEGVTLKQENIFAYCFECPKGGNLETLEEGEDYVLDYLNIHNVVNDDDLVGKVAMSAWGFIRYGVDGIYNAETGEITKVIPEKIDSSNQETRNMLALYQSIDNDLTRLTTLYKGDTPYHALETFQGIGVNQSYLKNLKKNRLLYKTMSRSFKQGINDYLLIQKTDMTMSEFLDLFCDSLADGFISRSYYVENFQSLFRLLGSSVFGNGNEAQKWKKVGSLWATELKGHTFELIEAYFKGSDAIADVLQKYLEKSLESAGIDYAAYEGLKDTLPLLMEAMGKALESGGIDLLLTLLNNAHLLILGHIPELCLAWLQSQDPNYEQDMKTALETKREPTVFVKNFFQALVKILGING